MNRKETALYLGMSEKTVSRAVNEKREEKRLNAERTATGDLEITVEEADRWKAQRDTLQPVQVEAQEEGETGQDSAALARVPVFPIRSQHHALTLESLAVAVVAIGEHLEARDTGTGQDKPRVSIAEKMLLDLEEAHQLSGLSRDDLRAALKAGALRGKKIGRGWKTTPGALQSYVDELVGKE